MVTDQLFPVRFVAAVDPAPDGALFVPPERSTVPLDRPNPSRAMRILFTSVSVRALAEASRFVRRSLPLTSRAASELLLQSNVARAVSELSPVNAVRLFPLTSKAVMDDCVNVNRTTDSGKAKPMPLTWTALVVAGVHARPLKLTGLVTARVAAVTVPVAVTSKLVMITLIRLPLFL